MREVGLDGDDSSTDLPPRRTQRQRNRSALRDHGEPVEIVTDKSPTLASVIADLVPDAEHCTEQYANNRIECDTAG